jgi:hypothetical protein
LTASLNAGILVIFLLLPLILIVVCGGFSWFYLFLDGIRARGPDFERLFGTAMAFSAILSPIFPHSSLFIEYGLFADLSRGAAGLSVRQTILTDTDQPPFFFQLHNHHGG